MRKKPFCLPCILEEARQKGVFKTRTNQESLSMQRGRGFFESLCISINSECLYICPGNVQAVLFPQSIVTSVSARKSLWRKFLEYILVLIILLLIISFPLETWPCLHSTSSGSQNFSKKPTSKGPSALLFLSESFGHQGRNSLVQNLAYRRQWVR